MYIYIYGIQYTVYIYIYMYIHTYILSARKGTNEVTNGVAASLKFFDTGTFWVLPLTYFDLPESARLTQSDKIHCLCSGPIRVDPICPQPNSVQRRVKL